MYGYSQDIELTSIVGSKLDWINLGHFIFDLDFDSGLHLSIRNDVLLSREGVEISSWSDYRWTSTAFQELLGKTARSYMVLNRDQLDIYFDDGYVLTLYENRHFESLEMFVPTASGRKGPINV